ncbi:hypothetical protein GCM10009798_06980 [Nocardioides panacihumi]|uniref:Secreted protein n=1 Tax=Nocardioides panacihumi TaxID=400774 RepID=A0ABN2QEE3_9ACTN
MIWSDGPVLRRALALTVTVCAVAVCAVAVCAVLGVVLGPQTSYAAPGCPRPAPAVAVQRATVVFTGVVTSATPSGTSFVHNVKVDRVYKGQVTTAEVRVRTTGGTCGLGRLTPDERYVVMAMPDGDSWLAGPRSGTAPASDALLARVQSLLGQGTAPTKAPTTPKQVTYQQVGADHPRPFLRVAAPGFALILVGLLGLVVARRWGRVPA